MQWLITTNVSVHQIKGIATNRTDSIVITVPNPTKTKMIYREMGRCIQIDWPPADRLTHLPVVDVCRTL